eukprot:5632298-Ditylum_brightwellii.AAC.1
MKESFLGKYFKSLDTLTRVARSRFLMSAPNALMEYLHSDRDLIVMTSGKMKNPCSIISADDKREKVKVTILYTTSALDTVTQNNPTTPINSNHGHDREER